MAPPTGRGRALARRRRRGASPLCGALSAARTRDHLARLTPRCPSRQAAADALTEQAPDTRAIEHAFAYTHEAHAAAAAIEVRKHVARGSLRCKLVLSPAVSPCARSESSTHATCSDLARSLVSSQSSAATCAVARKGCARADARRHPSCCKEARAEGTRTRQRRQLVSKRACEASVAATVSRDVANSSRRARACSRVPGADSRGSRWRASAPWVLRSVSWRATGGASQLAARVGKRRYAGTESGSPWPCTCRRVIASARF